MTNSRHWRCEASGLEISLADCLACAATFDNPCHFDPAMLLQIAGSDDERTGIHVSSLTNCLRKAWLRERHPRAGCPGDRLLMVYGLVLHEAVEESAPGGALVEKEIEVALDLPGEPEQVCLQGRVDLYLPEQELLVDYKSTRWLDTTRGAYGNAEEQVNIYAWMLEALGHPVHRAVLQYYDFSGPTTCRACKSTVTLDQVGEKWGFYCPQCGKLFPGGHRGAWRFEVPLSPRKTGEMVGERATILARALRTGVPPAVTRSWECNRCPHDGDCIEYF